MAVKEKISSYLYYNIFCFLYYKIKNIITADSKTLNKYELELRKIWSAAFENKDSTNFFFTDKILEALLPLPGTNLHEA